MFWSKTVSHIVICILSLKPYGTISLSNFQEIILHVQFSTALDASGSPGSGFFYGNNLWLGSYTQCEDLSNTKPFEISYEAVKHPNATPYDFPSFNLGFVVAYLEHNSTMQHHTQLPLEVRFRNLNLNLVKL